MCGEAVRWGSKLEEVKSKVEEHGWKGNLRWWGEVRGVEPQKSSLSVLKHSCLRVFALSILSAWIIDSFPHFT